MQRQPHVGYSLEEVLELTESSWVAGRAYSTTATGKPDAEAHTNPVYIYVDGKTPYQQADLDWLVERIDDQIAERRQLKRPVPERLRAARTTVRAFENAIDRICVYGAGRL